MTPKEQHQQAINEYDKCLVDISKLKKRIPYYIGVAFIFPFFFYSSKKRPCTFNCQQTGYATFSVSESVLYKTFNYIKNQKKHHQKKNFIQEYEEFLKLYGFDSDKNQHSRKMVKTISILRMAHSPWFKSWAIKKDIMNLLMRFKNKTYVFNRG